MLPTIHPGMHVQWVTWSVLLRCMVQEHRSTLVLPAGLAPLPPAYVDKGLASVASASTSMNTESSHAVRASVCVTGAWHCLGEGPMLGSCVWPGGSWPQLEKLAGSCRSTLHSPHCCRVRLSMLPLRQLVEAAGRAAR